MVEAKEVCDNIIMQVTRRYASPGYLIGSTLFVQEKFGSFRSSFPQSEIDTICTAYPMLVKEELCKELKTFFKRSDMHQYKSLLELLNFILDNNLDEVLGQTSVLLEVLLSTPMTTAEPERCFSTLKRIKPFLDLPCLMTDLMH